MTYMESKKKLGNIRQKYGCKGEMIFRTALTLIVEAGQCTILDEAWYQCELDDIDARFDAAEQEGKTLFVTREFEKAIFECARELAQIDAYNFLFYIQKEVWLGDSGIDYQRAIKLLNRCMASVEQYCGCDLQDTYETFYDIGFNDEELKELGYGYLLDIVEEE